MKYTSTFRALLAPFLVLFLSGCSWLGIGGDDGWLRDRQGAYLEASMAPRMDIPSELDSFTFDDLYRIPEEPPGQAEFFVTPPPPRPMDSRTREGVVVQRFGDRAWIVAGATPSQVWPRLLEYWPTEGIELSRTDATRGVMETIWLAEQNSERRHKYQVRVEPGLHAGNSEIYVREVADQGGSAPDEPREWPEESDNQEYETAIMSRISLYLADRSDLYRASSVSLLAGSIEADSKARLLTGRGNTPTRLELRIDFDRAWSQVNQSLGEAEIEVTGSDRDSGRFTVQFSGEEGEDEPGFFARLFGGGNDEAEARAFHVDLQGQDGAIMLEAAPVSGDEAPRLQDLLVRTINDNLI
ncbi:MAG: outer membrane protein assembly factor BamC [Pseudohongiellaceae bacterium]